MKTLKLKTLAVVVLLSTTIFTSCEKDELPKPTTNPNPFEPAMKVGDEAYYNVIMNTQTHENNFSIRVIEDLGNFKLKVVSVLQMFGVSDTVIWYEDNTGFYRIEEDGNKTLIASPNPNVGDTSYHVSGNDTIYRVVLEIDTAITVPLGTFNCMKIKEYIGGYNNYSIEYIDDKGLVKFEQYGVSPIKFELNSRNY